MESGLQREALILAGGFGSRLRPTVDNRPKPLAEVCGRPFLERLLQQLLRFDYQRAIMCVGYCGEQIRTQLGESYGALALDYSFETHPLGTGGALRKATSMVRGRYVLAMNGDSFCDMDLKELAEAHLKHGGEVTIAAVYLKARSQTVELDPDHRVVEFNSHPPPQTPGLISAGVYMFSREALDAIPEGRAVSLENEVFPQLAARKSLFGWPVEAAFIDIGTPESYQLAQKFFADR